MTENVLRWVIASGIALMSVMAVAAAAILLALYRSTKRMEDRARPVLEKALPILDAARLTLDEARPKIRAMIEQTLEITTMARDQVARIDTLVTETTERARVQIDRLDVMVADTVDRVQETTAAVQSTVLKPVREVNGVLSGFRAAISVLARGNRASVDHATQDEEMFI